MLTLCTRCIEQSSKNIPSKHNCSNDENSLILSFVYRSRKDKVHLINVVDNYRDHHNDL